MILPAIHAYGGSRDIWFVQAHIGTAIADGFWHGADGEVRSPSLRIFGTDPSLIVASFPIVSEEVAA